MNDIANIIINNGTAIGLLIYFIYKDNKFTETLNKSLINISNSLEIIQNLLEKKGAKKE